MPTLYSSLSKFVDDKTPFLKEVIGGDFNPYPEKASAFLNKMTMDAQHVDIGTRSALGAFSIKSEVGEQAEDSYLIGPQMRVSALEYAKQVPTSRISIEDSRSFKEAASMLAGIGKDIRKSADATKEILGHDILNASTYLTPDGIALFSEASHVNLQGDTYGNYDATAALSETTLEAALLALKQMTDDRGFPIMQNSVKLIVPLELEWLAMKLLENPLKHNSANNDISVVSRQSLSLEVSPYLTSAVKWFVQCADHGLNWYDRETFRVWNDTDDNRGIVTQGATFRCALGASDPRGIYANLG